jgi:iron complex outermembrane receptor protein
MKKIIYIFLVSIFTSAVFAQEPEKDISQMTKEDVLELTYDELLEMPFEDVLKLADIVGVSLEELYELLLNKDVVSASKKVESSFEAPLSTSVISYDEIIASGARSVEDALRLVPGLIVREKTNGNFDVHIRGNDNLPPHHMLLYSENSNTLVMIDGRPVYNYVHGGTFWETLPVGLSDIERIEVVRGPSSALYGPNAVSGVVNIISKHQESKKLSVDGNLQTGTQNTIITSVGVGKTFNSNFGFRVTGNYEGMNRNTDLLYVHKANDKQGGFISKETLDTLQEFVNNPFEAGWYSVFDPSDDINDMFPNPANAREKAGANAYLYYDPTEDVHFSLKGGLQSSEILSSTMGDNPSAHVGRVSNTGYVDFIADAKGLKAQLNYLGGWQDIVRSDTGFKVDLKNVNAIAEYDIHVQNLNIRPGLAYQLSEYNDLEYLSEEGQGFLNGNKQFNSTALSLRLDYVAWEKLRFIAAIRAEKYNTQEKTYISYQLIGSYILNDIHNFRLVRSRANRGPFLVDSYANYLWDRENRPLPGHILFLGDKQLNLLTMDMFEIGYRVKPVKNVIIDIEAFLNKTKNYGALYPSFVDMAGYENNGRAYVEMTYMNFELESKQLGLTADVSWVATEDLILKVFGTYQQTQLTDSPILSPDNATTLMFIAAANDPTGTTDVTPNVTKNVKNKATPSFYGGFVLNYNYKEKLNVNTSGYYTSKQEFYSKYGSQNIESKMVLNLKVGYNITSNVTLFGNIRNILGEQREFAYMDNIGTLYLAGITINY